MSTLREDQVKYRDNISKKLESFYGDTTPEKVDTVETITEASPSAEAGKEMLKTAGKKWKKLGSAANKKVGSMKVIGTDSPTGKMVQKGYEKIGKAIKPEKKPSPEQLARQEKGAKRLAQMKADAKKKKVMKAKAVKGAAGAAAAGIAGLAAYKLYKAWKAKRAAAKTAEAKAKASKEMAKAKAKMSETIQVGIDDIDIMILEIEANEELKTIQEGTNE